ncbi:hypothetical protein OC835_003103, partial [Tilletia horrida]
MDRAQAVPETQFSEDDSSHASSDWDPLAPSSLLARQPAPPLYGTGEPPSPSSDTVEQLRAQMTSATAANASLRAQLDRYIEASIEDRRRIRQQDNRILELDDERDALLHKLDMQRLDKKQATRALVKCMHQANRRLSRLRRQARQVEEL